MLTVSEENYLKCIFRLSQETGNKITPTAIAETLAHNAASVVDMIKKLAHKKFITYNKTTGVKLCDKGHKVAIQIVRKHRLWEVFLTDRLGYTWGDVHDIAEQLEHVQHTELADRLDKYLGYPVYDPHGDPIPQINGKMAKIFKTTLTEVKEKERYQVVGVKDSSSSFLQYLQKLKISIGTKITIVEKISFDESIIINIDNSNKITVSKKFAENILVNK
jgi:DtxR family transcriptional regulator, Mn-dependent transcriptional regulator